MKSKNTKQRITEVLEILNDLDSKEKQYLGELFATSARYEELGNDVAAEYALSEFNMLLFGYLSNYIFLEDIATD